MNVVWDVLNQCDDLVMIKDLRHINDMKNLMAAIAEFKKIMSKAKGIEVNHVEHNPLMRATGTPDQSIAEYDKIRADQRLYGKYQTVIDDGISELYQLKDR